MSDTDLKNFKKTIFFIPRLFLIWIIFIVISIILNISELFNLVDISKIPDKFEISCLFILFIIAVLVALTVLYIKVSISMIQSRKEMKELEKDALIGGMMLLSVIPLAIIGYIPYFGDVISGFMPLLYFGSFLIFFRKLIPKNWKIIHTISLGIVMVTTLISVTTRMSSLMNMKDVSYLLSIINGLIQIFLLFQILRMNNVLKRKWIR